jgi:UDPglucose 6-dehydrogenase
MAACFASRGFKVIGVEIDDKRIRAINRGQSPIHEPDLDRFLREAVQKGLLSCTSDHCHAVRETHASFITVSTPLATDGNASLEQVKEVSKHIGEGLERKRCYHLVTVKSTVPPGTTEGYIKKIIEAESGKRCGIDFGLCANPEFLREGSAIQDVLNQDRIIIGEFDKRSGDALENLYRRVYGNHMPPLIRTNPVNAELIKFASNAFLATKISFINTIANICEKILKADVTVVAKGMGLDKRIGSQFLNAGLGYGGSCLPKDIKALITISSGLGYNPALLNEVEELNKVQPYKVVELCKTALGNLQGKRVAILGLAFKPNTDDVRDAVSIKIIHRFLEEGANVVAYDPVAVNNVKRIFKNKIEYAQSASVCINNADCCIIVTEWDEFKMLKPEDFIKHMKKPVLLDGRRIYNPTVFKGKVKFLAVGLANSSDGSNDRQK